VKQTVKLRELLKYNLRSVKAHLMREDFNNKAKLTMRKAYGFKTFENIQIALFHQLGKLPEPKSTHRFC